VPFLASLFVVSEALEATGVTTWAGQQLIARVGGSRTRLVVLTMLLSAGLAALIVPNGTVAALIPMTVILAVRLGRSPSSVLMPMAFGAHAGSLLLLTGSPINVIVSEAAVDAGEHSFGFFEYGLAGIPLVVGTIAIVVLFRPAPGAAAHAQVDPTQPQRLRAHHAQTLQLAGGVGAAAS
jgi:Na+/H+ antiporter NhaD/arsenite permease-like protein